MKLGDEAWFTLFTGLQVQALKSYSMPDSVNNFWCKEMSPPLTPATKLEAQNTDSLKVAGYIDYDITGLF